MASLTMEEGDSEKQQRVGKGSSVLRKPLSDLTNLIREPHRRSISFSQLKKPIKSADPAMSSTGSTQIHSLVQHQFTAPRDQHPLLTPRTPSPVTLNVARTQKRRYDSVRDGKHIAYSESQTNMKTRSKTKTNTIPVYPIHLEKTKNTTMKGIPMPHSTGKTKDKSKEISVPPKYPPVVNTININMEPLSGVKFNNKEKTVADLSKEYEGKMVATPINYEVNGAEISSQFKSEKAHLPNNKKRSRSSKGSSKKFVLPQDFIDQQRAYFKEIEDYELQVEEETDEVSP